MASPTEEKSMAAAEACEAPRESHNSELHQDQHRFETQAAAPTEHHPLVKQSSMLSLTLDEIQTTVCGPGKSFGSMNIDEFFTNIWTLEKGGAEGPGGVSNEQLGTLPNAATDGGLPPTSQWGEGSLPIPAPLCRKTVDEVWSDIDRGQQQTPQGHMQPQLNQDLGNPARHPTLGEMTLEDFLVKVGIVREGGYLPCSSPLPLNQLPPQSQQLQQQNQSYSFSDGYPREGSGAPVVGVGRGGHQNHLAADDNEACHSHPHQQKVLLGNDGAGVGSPVSPLSSDGFGGAQVVSIHAGGQHWGGSRRGGGGAAGGKKRILDGGPVEVVVERRQRRMMKNRESAARSRARKQAYTVELEKELNFLKEENARLQEEQRRTTARRRQTLLESMAEQSGVNLQRNAKILRQCCSCVW